MPSVAIRGHPADDPKIDSLPCARGDEIGLSIADRHGDRIEETRIARSESQSLQPAARTAVRCLTVRAMRSQSLRAV
jgi:hypothetical protein